MKKRVIIIGGAGFIGSNLCDYLLDDENEVVCIDNFDDYYDKNIKVANLKYAKTFEKFILIENDIRNHEKFINRFSGKYDAIVNLAAKPGVRYSISNKNECYENNIYALKSSLELLKKLEIKKYIFSSSSTIYGNKSIPFLESDENLIPLNPYAEVKLESEQYGKTFAEKNKIDFFSLRFFSVYGQRMRPDLLLYKITKSLLTNEKIKIFGDGSATRDYTYITDIVSGIVAALNTEIECFEIFNLGNNKSISLLEIFDIFENISGKKLNYDFVPAINGESEKTCADINKAKSILGYLPKTDILEGIKKYYNWFINVYL